MFIYSGKVPGSNPVRMWDRSVTLMLAGVHLIRPFGAPSPQGEGFWVTGEPNRCLPLEGKVPVRADEVGYR